MRGYLFLFLFGFSSVAGAIINGTEVTRAEPYAKSVVGLARKLKNGGYHIFCTGSLVNKNTLVTAAHCLYMRDNSLPMRNGELTVVFGLSEKHQNLQVRKMIRKKTHEAYKPGHKNDEVDIFEIALAQFDGEAPPDYVPLPVLAPEVALDVGMKVILTGYGFNDALTPKGSGTLRQTIVPIKDKSATEVVTNESRSGSCNIDSGGPGVIEIAGEHYLWGITSRGDPSCVGEGHYTQIPVYLDWIDQKLNYLDDWIVL